MSGCGYAFLYLGTILFTRICISIGLKTNGHHQLQAKHGVLEVTVANNIHHCAITIFTKSSSSNRIIDRNRLVGINTPGSANKHTHTAHTHIHTHLYIYTHTLHLYYFHLLSIYCGTPIQNFYSRFSDDVRLATFYWQPKKGRFPKATATTTNICSKKSFWFIKIT